MKNIVKAKAPLITFYEKLKQLQTLCEFFETNEIEGYPEDEPENLAMLEELAYEADDSQYEGVKSALFEICDDLQRRFETCEEIANEEASKEFEEYKAMIMRQETHLNPKIN
jgi:hypothetical protein